MSSPKTIIGRVEKVSFPTLGIKHILAKVDTGADASSIWCGKIKKRNDHLECVFFGPDSPFYSGQSVIFSSRDVDLTRVANSFGHRQLRYKVKIPMEVHGRTIKATFTLTDRSSKLYPILIGRSTLQGKFLVDVSKGNPLYEEEGHRKKRLELEMKRLKKELRL